MRHMKTLTVERVDLIKSAEKLPIKDIKTNHIRGPVNVVYVANKVIFIDDDGTEKILKLRH